MFRLQTTNVLIQIIAILFEERLTVVTSRYAHTGTSVPDGIARGNLLYMGSSSITTIRKTLRTLQSPLKCNKDSNFPSL